jgi:tetratricopeptide (TPR) repeat protein
MSTKHKASLLSPKTIVWLLVISLLSFVYVSQIFYDSSRIDKKKNIKTQPFVLAPKAMKDASLGFNSLLADITWIQAIQYFGGWAPTDEGYNKLPQMLDTITELEPKFEYPYIFACLILPGEGYTKEAIEIGKRGTDTIQISWQVPYYLAFVYHKEKDYENAAKYFSIAAERPDTLPIVKVLSGIYYAKAGERDVAIAIWQGIYDSSDNEFIKGRAKVWLDHYEYMAGIEKLNQIYKEKFGSFPSSLQALFDKKILPELPTDSLNQNLEIDPSTGKVKDKETK